MGNMERIVQQITKAFGKSIWRDESRCIGAFMDLAPSKVREIRFLRDFISSGASSLLIQNSNVYSDRDETIKRAIMIMQATTFYSDDVIREFCSAFLDGISLSSTDADYKEEIMHPYNSEITHNGSILISDHGLEAAIRGSLELGSDLLTEGDLQKLTVLDARCKSIKKIEALRYCKNLRRLILPGNQISDITPLQECHRLQEIDLSENTIENIEPLRHMPLLRIVNLASNKISDIDPLNSARHLKVLILSNNRIVSLDSIKQLKKLIMLEVDNNKIESIDALRGLQQLRVLCLNDNRIGNVESITEMRNLSIIWIGKTIIPKKVMQKTLGKLGKLYAAYYESVC